MFGAQSKVRASAACAAVGHASVAQLDVVVVGEEHFADAAGVAADLT
jgi:hypothetical protein